MSFGRQMQPVHHLHGLICLRRPAVQTLIYVVLQLCHSPVS